MIQMVSGFINHMYQMCVSNIFPSDHACLDLCESMHNIKFNPVTIRLSTERESSHVMADT